MKLWGGRFGEEQDDRMRLFNDSLHFDRRLYAVDIRGSRAYAAELHRTGLLDRAELEDILRGLEIIAGEFEQDTFEVKQGDEDIHTAVERRLTELIGAAAGKLHTGRSRNDQVALDFRLYVLDCIRQVRKDLAALQAAILAQAEAHLDLIMPGYTHVQEAQPVLFSHWIMSYFWMFDRDQDRLVDCARRTAVSPLGAGALAGNPFAIDREKLAAALGLPKASQNSMDAVSDRDFAAEFLFAASMIAVHASRLAEDLILYSSTGFGFVTIAEAYATGSSLMPQKRNPDSLELVRGKSGRIIGSLVNLLVVLKGLPSTYNKDLQEDKEGLFDTADTLAVYLPILNGVVETLEVRPLKMAAAVNEAMLATDLADYLVRKGVPFRTAHHLTGEAIRLSEERALPLSQLPLEELQEISDQFEEDFREVLNASSSVSRRNVAGGTAPEAVRHQLGLAKKRLDSHWVPQ